MTAVRFSRPEDIPVLRELWELAFGDSGAYMDNFFHTYYRPGRMLVLEGIRLLPGSIMPRDSHRQAMVFAVPRKGHTPGPV